MRSSRYVLAAVVVASPTLFAVVGSPSGAMADTPMPPTINCPASSAGTGVTDFDGDGIADAVVSAPGATHGAGLVEVRYSRSSRTTTFAPGDGTLPAVSGDGPAITFTTDDINSDGCADLVIGIPSYTVGSASQAGAIQVLYGSKDGFVNGPLITPDNADLPGSAQSGEHFGAALAGSGAQLTVGAPGWSPTVGSKQTSRAGEAIVLDVDPYLTSGVDGVYALRKTYPHADDRLGAAVAPSIAAAPTAQGHGHAAAGCLVVGYSQHLTTYCGHHAGDRLGQSLSLVGYSSGGQLLDVGSPGHEVMVKVTVTHGKDKGKTRVHTLTNAGVTEQFLLTYHSGDPVLTLQHSINQATKGVPGSPTKGNEFGYSVTTFAGHKDLLAVGVPGETVAGHRHAGAVLLRRGSATSSPWQQIDRAEKGVPGPAAANDRFGQAVHFAGRGYPGSDRDFLLYVGTPDETVSGHADAGRVEIFYGKGTKAGLSSAQLLTRSGGTNAHDRYGYAVD